MKKAITMILAITLAITAVAPSNKANAEGVRIETAPSDTLTQAPEPPRHINIQAYDPEGDCNDGDTVLVTKGFKRELSLNGSYEGTVQWTSSRPDIATVSAGGTVTGKNYGKATITAHYGGIVSYITMKVVKNEYSAKMFSNECITSMKFDKKGNLKCIYKTMKELSKSEIKKAKKNGDINLFKPEHALHTGICDVGQKLVIKNSKGKVVFSKKISNSEKDNFCCKNKKNLCHDKTGFDYKPGLNKPRSIKFTVKKKYLKKLKDVDLRTCKVEF